MAGRCRSRGHWHWPGQGQVQGHARVVTRVSVQTVLTSMVESISTGAATQSGRNLLEEYSWRRFSGRDKDSSGGEGKALEDMNCSHEARKDATNSKGEAHEAIPNRPMISS